MPAPAESRSAAPTLARATPSRSGHTSARARPSIAPSDSLPRHTQIRPTAITRCSSRPYAQVVSRPLRRDTTRASQTPCLLHRERMKQQLRFVYALVEPLLVTPGKQVELRRDFDP